jgi:hypothetical protein
LVIANVLTTTRGVAPDISYQINNGYVSGGANGKQFVFSTKPGDLFSNGEFTTDALILKWNSSTIFAAIVKLLKRGKKLIINSDKPITCEISGKSIKYYHREETEVTIGVEAEPAAVIVNGKEVTEWKYNNEDENIKIKLPGGEGNLTIK